MQRMPKTIEQFLALPQVFPFSGIEYCRVEPNEWKIERIYCIENRVEKWCLVWDEGQFKRLKIPTNKDLSRMMIQGLSERLRNT